MRNPLVPAVVVVALIIFLGETLFGCFSDWCDPSRKPSHYSHYVVQPNPGQEGQWMRVRLVSLPEERNRSLRITAEVLEIADSNEVIHSCQGKMLLYVEKSETPLRHGDELLLLATPDLPSADDNPHQFNYRQYLKNKGILYTDYIPSSSFRVIGHNGSDFMSIVSDIRLRFINVIRNSRLTPSQQGIAEALLLGWDNDLDSETESHFRDAGITHLLCVSGLHVGIIALLSGHLLFFLSNRRRSRLFKGLFQLTIIWVFVILTGLSPGTMRAGLMFSLVVLGQMLFSRPPTLNTIAASALILLVANPLLLFDVGFQLSYCSVFAIVTLTPHLEELIPLPSSEGKLPTLVLRLLRKLRALFCVSLAAQLAITPLTLFYFHQFPLYFLLANMVVVPFAGLLLTTAIFMLAFCWWPWMFTLIAKLLSALLAATEWVTAGVASLPGAVISNVWFDGWMLLLAFAIVVFLSLLLTGRKLWTLQVALLMTIATTLYSKKIEQLCAEQLHCDIYRVGNRTAMEFFVGHDSYLLCDSNVAANPESIDFQTSGNLLWRKAKRKAILRLDTIYDNPWLLIDNGFVAFNGKTMRIIDRSNYRQQSNSHPRLDYLLLRESPYITVEQLRKQYSFDTLIIASQNSQRRRKAWQQECDSLSIPCRE